VNAGNGDGGGFVTGLARDRSVPKYRAPRISPIVPAVVYVEWWRGRVIKGDALPKTANRDIGQPSRMLKDVSVRRRLKIPDIFKGLHLRGDVLLRRVPVALGPCWSESCSREAVLRIGAVVGWNDQAAGAALESFETERTAFLQRSRTAVKLTTAAD